MAMEVSIGSDSSTLAREARVAMRPARALASASTAATMAAEQLARLGPRGTITRRCYDAGERPTAAHRRKLARVYRCTLEELGFGD